MKVRGRCKNNPDGPGSLLRCGGVLARVFHNLPEWTWREMERENND
jgi:hypothetical protein